MRKASKMVLTVHSRKCDFGHSIQAQIDKGTYMRVADQQAGWEIVATMATVDKLAAILHCKPVWRLDAPRNCGEPECPHCEYAGPSHTWF